MPHAIQAAATFACLAAMLGAGPAAAGSLSTTLNVSATVVNGCAVDTPSVRGSASQRDLTASVHCSGATLVQASVLGSTLRASGSATLGRAATPLSTTILQPRSASDSPVLQILF